MNTKHAQVIIKRTPAGNCFICTKLIYEYKLLGGNETVEQWLGYYPHDADCGGNCWECQEQIEH